MADAYLIMLAGLVTNNHYVEILTSDAPYFVEEVVLPPIRRRILRYYKEFSLQGSYDGGISLITNPHQIDQINSHNLSACQSRLRKIF